MCLMELLGIVSILPFMTIVTTPETIHTNKYLYYFYELGHFQSNQSFLVTVGIFAFLSLVISNTFRALSSYLLLKFGHMQSYYLSQRVLTNYLNQPYEFFLSRNSSDLIKNVISEVGQVVNGIFIPLLRATGRVFSAVFIITILILVNPLLALSVAGTLGVAYFAIYKALKNKITTTGKESTSANRLRTRVVSEASGGIKEVKLMNKELRYIEAFKDPSISYAKAQTHNAVIGDFSRSAIETIAFGGVILIVIYLITTFDKNQAITITSFYAFAGYKLMPSLQEVFNSVTKIRFHIHSIDVLCESLNMQNFHDVKSSTVYTPLDFNNMIELRNVNFKYESAHKDSIPQINLKIVENTSVGIIGATGSGKTTLIDIILGLLRPTYGELLVDGVEVTKDNLSSWQMNIGYVPQSIYLSDESIAANIAFGTSKSLIDYEKVRFAAKLAQIDTFIENELILGYETVVGERGVRLSGGQRQRIGIARALYHNPKILILDEATSALDSTVEKEVISAIQALHGKKTIIMIAHRMSTVENCDEIILLDKGNIIARGPYKQVIDLQTQLLSKI